MRTRLPTLLLALLLLPLPAALAAQTAGAEGPYTPHPEALEAIGKLKSPYCPGFMLEVCPSPQATALRDSIQMLAEQGWSSERLVAWMLENHGEEWRAVPRAEGSGIWAWIMPPAFLLLGVGLVVVVLRRLGGGATPTHREGAEVSEEEEARLREALRELEASEDPLF